MNKKIFYVLFPLLIGVLIYIIFRSKSLFYFHFFKLTNLDNYILTIRKFFFKNYRHYFPNWVIYSLPDGLWLFSFGIALLFQSRFFYKNLITFSLITFFMIFFEYAQKIHGGHGSLIGTFDARDVYCFLGGYTLSSLLAYYSIKKNHIVSINSSYLISLKNSFPIILVFAILAILPTLFHFK